MLLGLTRYLFAEGKNFPSSFACPTTKKHVVRRNARTRNPVLSVNSKNLQTLSPSNKISQYSDRLRFRRLLLRFLVGAGIVSFLTIVSLRFLRPPIAFPSGTGAL
jgi:hypothetical protein